MILIGVLLVVFMITMIYQQRKGVERPWTQCKESMVTQMFTGECTPSQFSAPYMRGPLQDAPQTDRPQEDRPQSDIPQTDVPQTEIPQTGGYEGDRLENM